VMHGDGSRASFIYDAWGRFSRLIYFETSI
jgi:hypothetical protein